MGINRQISQEQKEILNLLTSEFLTPKQIAKRRKTTVWAVYKTIRKLTDKGLYKKGTNIGVQKGGVEIPKNIKNKAVLSLHAIQETIKIIQKSVKYEKELLSKSNKLSISGCTILFYKDSLDIYTQEGISFTGLSTNECYQRAITYFCYIYARIENRLGITIDKEGYLNKRWVRQHIARTNDEIAADCNSKRERLIVFDKEDGKERVHTDDSYNRNDLEFTHPKKAKSDTDAYVAFIEDIIENRPLSNSQLTSRLNDVITALEKMKEIIEKKL